MLILDLNDDIVQTAYRRLRHGFKSWNFEYRASSVHGRLQTEKSEEKESRVWFFYACAMKCKYCDGRKRLRFFLFRRKKKRGGNVEFCANARIVLGNEGRFSLTAHTMLQYHRRTLRLVSAYIEVSHETVACPLTHTLEYRACTHYASCTCGKNPNKKCKDELNEC